MVFWIKKNMLKRLIKAYQCKAKEDRKIVEEWEDIN